MFFVKNLFQTKQQVEYRLYKAHCIPSYTVSFNWLLRTLILVLLGKFEHAALWFNWDEVILG